MPRDKRGEKGNRMNTTQRTALVTAIGSFSADAVIRTLRQEGWRIIGTDIYEADWVAASLMVDAFYQAPYASEEEKYIDFIRDICAREQVSRILPLIDVEVDALNRHRAEIETGDCRICMSPEKSIRILRDKFEMKTLVDGVLEESPEEIRQAVRTIPTERASEIDFETVRYPVILKPVDGRSSSGLYRIYQEDQLGFAFSSIMDPTKLEDSSLEHYLVQPMIKGHVITVDVIRDAAGHCTAVPREELLRTPNGAGLSVRVFEDPVLEAACRAIAARAEILGCVNFEFIRGEGSGIYYFIECNPRFAGGVAFTELAEVPAVHMHLAIFDGAEISGEEKPVTGFMTRKYQEFRM